jgi:hypothetical protein
MLAWLTQGFSPRDRRLHEDAWRPGREPISLAVYAALGPPAKPSLAVHLLRRRGRGGRALLTSRRWRARM